MAQESSKKPSRCNRCGETWPRDPALEVVCPVCHAGVGKPCMRPSEHKAFRLHAERDVAAMAAGVLKKCTGALVEKNSP
jgi:hypothetical protein